MRQVDTLLISTKNSHTQVNTQGSTVALNRDNSSTHLYYSSKPVQAVADRNVDRLPEYSVPPLRICNNLQRETREISLVNLYFISAKKNP